MTILPTHFIAAERLSDILGVSITLVSEAHQHTGSFKFRAALHVVQSVPNKRFIAASSGNFGQALARACALNDKQCTIVMPHNSARVKVDAVRGWGATVELIDTTRIKRAERIRQLADADPDAYIAGAYDDIRVILGIASLGEEIGVWANGKSLDAVIVPIGCGGLAAGVITGLRRIGCDTPVYGAEPLLANDAARSLREGRIITNTSEPQTIADGARTVSLGVANWTVLQEQIEDIIEVEESAIAAAVCLLFLLANVKAEPTGALALGGIMQAREQFHGQHVGCVVSGGNVDPERYADILRGLL